MPNSWDGKDQIVEKYYLDSTEIQKCILISAINMNLNL